MVRNQSGNGGPEASLGPLDQFRHRGPEAPPVRLKQRPERGRVEGLDGDGRGDLGEDRIGIRDIHQRSPPAD
jgi:hypothetical protein